MNTIIHDDAVIGLSTILDGTVNCCVTSPPYYGLRDYGDTRQIGLEETPEEYISKLTNVFKEVKRVLRDDGTLWVNIGDSYAGSMKGAARFPENAMNYKQGTNRGTLGRDTLVKQCTGCKPKDMIGIPWMLAFALRADGWYWRDTIIWAKPNPMPESVSDRTTKSHEYILLFSKNKTYYYNADVISEPCVQGDENIRDREHTKLNNCPGRKKMGGLLRNNYQQRNKRSVWTVATTPLRDAHFATFPEKLIVHCIKAGCPEGGVVLDPFFGSGTTGIVSRKLDRNYIGCEINASYIKIARKREREELGLFAV